MQERFYPPKYSKLARLLEVVEKQRKWEIERIERNYRQVLEIVKRICEENGHKYDDGVSAVIRYRCGYNDYRYKCQICGAEMPDND